MRLLVEYYARVWITVLISVSVILAFSMATYNGQQSFPTTLGKMMEMVLSVKSEKTGSAFDSYMKNIPPMFSVKNIDKIKAGKEVRISDCFSAFDSEGREISVNIVCGWNEIGDFINLSISSEGTFCIEDPGRYWIMASATDKWGLKKDIMVQIFVNRE